MKSHVVHTVWCNISAGAAGEIWHWSLLGVKGLMKWQVSGLTWPSKSWNELSFLWIATSVVFICVSASDRTGMPAWTSLKVASNLEIQRLCEPPQLKEWLDWNRTISHPCEVHNSWIRVPLWYLLGIEKYDRPIFRYLFRYQKLEYLPFYQRLVVVINLLKLFPHCFWLLLQQLPGFNVPLQVFLLFFFLFFQDCHSEKLDNSNLVTLNKGRNSPQAC